MQNKTAWSQIISVVNKQAQSFNSVNCQLLDKEKAGAARRPQPAARDLPRRAVGARNARAVRLRAAAGGNRPQSYSFERRNGQTSLGDIHLDQQFCKKSESYENVTKL